MPAPGLFFFFLHPPAFPLLSFFNYLYLNRGCHDCYLGYFFCVFLLLFLFFMSSITFAHDITTFKYPVYFTCSLAENNLSGKVLFKLLQSVAGGLGFSQLFVLAHAAAENPAAGKNFHGK